MLNSSGSGTLPYKDSNFVQSGTMAFCNVNSAVFTKYLGFSITFTDTRLLLSMCNSCVLPKFLMSLYLHNLLEGDLELLRANSK